MEHERRVQVTNPQGLHVRIGVKLVEEARKFKSDIFIGDDKEMVNGKDIMSVLTLGAEKGRWLKLRAVGEDAEAAIDSLEVLFKSNFKS